MLVGQVTSSHARPPGMPLLELRDIAKRFGGVTAVDAVSFHIEQASITGLIGPNGSGKTTIFNIITNLIAADRGEVLFRGERVTGLKPFQAARKGLGRTFQIVRLFRKMSVLDNLLASGLFRYGMQGLERARQLLDFVELNHLEDAEARTLSYGQQKLLEFACALMPDPALLLLDEPVAGINPRLIEKMAELIKELNRSGKTFLVIEHNMPFVMGICDRIVALDVGVKIAEGPPEAIQAHHRVIDAYLGRTAHAPRSA
jgi:branched-chain amino acid transport system permease protein